MKFVIQFWSSTHQHWTKSDHTNALHGITDLATADEIFKERASKGIFKKYRMIEMPDDAVYVENKVYPVASFYARSRPYINSDPKDFTVET
jgi:hypothetical protein